MNFNNSKLFFKSTTEYQQICQEEIAKVNMRNLKKCAIVLSIFFMMYGLWSIFVTKIITTAIISFILSFLQLLLLLFYQPINNNLLSKKYIFKSKILCYVELILVIVCCLLIGLFSSTSTLGYLFCFSLIIMPLLFSLSIFYLTFIDVFLTVVYFLLCFIFKEDYLTLFEFEIVFASLLVYFLLLLYIYSLRVKEFNRKKELSLLGSKDKLTGLLSKSGAEFTAKIYVNETNMNYAIILIDIDEFGYINLTEGEMKGDEILKDISVILNSLFRGNDIVARMGGDQFMVLMRDIKTLKIIQTKALQIIEKINSIVVSNKVDSLSCSLGIYVATPFEKDFTRSFKRASQALNQSKNNKGSYIISSFEYNPELSEKKVLLIASNSEELSKELKIRLGETFDFIHVKHGKEFLKMVNRLSSNLHAILINHDLKELIDPMLIAKINKNQEQRRIPIFVIVNTKKDQNIISDIGVQEVYLYPFDYNQMELDIKNLSN